MGIDYDGHTAFTQAYFQSNGYINRDIMFSKDKMLVIFSGALTVLMVGLAILVGFVHILPCHLGICGMVL